MPKSISSRVSTSPLELGGSFLFKTFIEVSCSYELIVDKEELNSSPPSQTPLHLVGTLVDVIPSSLKLKLSGHTPLSMTPMIMSSP